LFRYGEYEITGVVAKTSQANGLKQTDLKALNTNSLYIVEGNDTRLLLQDVTCWSQDAVYIA